MCIIHSFIIAQLASTRPSLRLSLPNNGSRLSLFTAATCQAVEMLASEDECGIICLQLIIPRSLPRSFAPSSHTRGTFFHSQPGGMTEIVRMANAGFEEVCISKREGGLIGRTALRTFVRIPSRHEAEPLLRPNGRGLLLLWFACHDVLHPPPLDLSSFIHVPPQIDNEVEPVPWVLHRH